MQHTVCYYKLLIQGGQYRRPNISKFAEKTYAISQFLAKILPVPKKLNEFVVQEVSHLFGKIIFKFKSIHYTAADGLG